MHSNESNGNDQVFKDSSQPPEEHSLAVKDVEAVRNEIEDELKPLLAKFRDPVVLASLLYRTVQEKENSNRLMKTIIARLDALEGRLARIEEAAGGSARRPAPAVIPEIDQRILDFVKSKRFACAEEVQSALKYKGKNAASARLNKLFEMGLLEKSQSGRKVFYKISDG